MKLQLIQQSLVLHFRLIFQRLLVSISTGSNTSAGQTGVTGGLVTFKHATVNHATVSGRVRVKWQKSFTVSGPTLVWLSREKQWCSQRNRRLPLPGEIFKKVAPFSLFGKCTKKEATPNHRTIDHGTFCAQDILQLSVGKIRCGGVFWCTVDWKIVKAFSKCSPLLWCQNLTTSLLRSGDMPAINNWKFKKKADCWQMDG